VEDKQVELSRILLTRVNRFGEPLDGFIHLYDLFGVRMGPSLVILAACETSGGPSERGEAILGLARGFLEAGVTGLMTTSSTLDEESTSYFMKHFFDALMQIPGTSPSSALLAARRAMAEKSRWNDAYYWGSLTLISGVS
jgi:CHAT domain-containing protein